MSTYSKILDTLGLKNVNPGAWSGSGGWSTASDGALIDSVNPATGELVTLRERPRMARFFKIEQEPDRLLWHCIVNPTERHRWSFGFVVPEHWAERLADHS